MKDFLIVDHKGNILTKKPKMRLNIISWKDDNTTLTFKNKYEILWFTNRFDKNKKRIFEGSEVLYLKRRIGYVYFDYGAFKIQTFLKDEPVNYAHFLYDVRSEDIELISIKITDPILKEHYEARKKGMISDWWKK